MELNRPAKALFINHEDENERKPYPQNSGLAKDHSANLTSGRSQKAQQPDFSLSVDHQRHQRSYHPDDGDAECDSLQSICKYESPVKNLKLLVGERAVGKHHKFMWRACLL